MLIFGRSNFRLTMRVLFLDLRILKDKDLDLFSGGFGFCGVAIGEVISNAFL